VGLRVGDPRLAKGPNGRAVRGLRAGGWRLTTRSPDAVPRRS
jgi:hypothetical protein